MAKAQESFVFHRLIQGKHFKLLLRNHWASLSQISHGASMGWGKESLFMVSGHMTKMATISIYGKKPLKVFYSRTKWQMTLGIGMLHWGHRPTKV